MHLSNLLTINGEPVHGGLLMNYFQSNKTTFSTTLTKVIKMAKHINSLLIEFEPVLPEKWPHLRRDIMDVLHTYRVQIITWETGFCYKPDTNDQQQDLYGSTD